MHTFRLCYNILPGMFINVVDQIDIKVTLNSVRQFVDCAPNVF